MSARSVQIYTGKLLEEQVHNLNLNAGNIIRWTVLKSQSAPEEYRLQADYKFKTFAKTWKFLNSIVIPAHSMKHHPTITTTYNQVKIILTTHDVGNKITALDLKLAELINQTYKTDFAVPTSQTTNSNDASLSEASKIINELVSINKNESKN